MSQLRPGADPIVVADVPDAEPQPAAAERLAAALGWPEVPVLSDEERRELDEEFEAAQAEARRFYGLDDPE